MLEIKIVKEYSTIEEYLLHRVQNLEKENKELMSKILELENSNNRTV